MLSSRPGFTSGQGLLGALAAQHGGLLEEVEYDHSENRVVVRTTQDVEPYLDYCSERQQDGTNGYSKDRNIRQIAEVPLVFVMKWLNEPCPCDQGGGIGQPRGTPHGFNVFRCSDEALRRKLRELKRTHTCDGRF